LITEAGHYALVLAFILALAQSSLPLIGAQRGIRAWMGLARLTAFGQLGFLSLAFLALIHAYVVSDFSVAAVYENSHAEQPLLYKVAASWGNHEGSLLLWVLVLALFGCFVAALGGNLPPRLKARTLAVQGMIGAAFMAFMLSVSNPFARLFPVPVEGAELNPLLQDPGLAMHPPLLYLGYVGFSITFSFAIAALIEGKVDGPWARWVRPWALLSWTALTAGIALGAHWAYAELGWGGWWYWDPVENASFMPWLMGTALLHSAIVVEKRGTLKSWTILLAILTFVFSLLGTFLVRSGIITSVHAFAQDPTRGLFILAIIGGSIGGALGLFAWRAPALKGGGLFAPISREGALILNNLLLATATATVLLGTLYPLLLEILGGGTVSVGPPYYASTFVPLITPLLILTAAGPFLGWKRGDLAAVRARLVWAGAAALGAAFLTLWLRWGGPLSAMIGMAVGVWLLIGTLLELAERLHLFRGRLYESWRRARHLPRAAYGMTLAHAGLAILTLGITGSVSWKSEDVRLMHPGETAKIAGYAYRLDGVSPIKGPNYLAEQASFTITREGRTIAVLHPERRQYRVQPAPTTEAAIDSGLWGDLYAVIGEPDGKGGWTVRLYHQPMVPWIWAGAFLMALGGAVSMSDRRYRIGAPQHARQQARAATLQAVGSAAAATPEA